jgi:hypothetical protein
VQIKKIMIFSLDGIVGITVKQKFVLLTSSQTCYISLQNTQGMFANFVFIGLGIFYGINKTIIEKFWPLWM